ncbi:tRNA pseudouridine synthase 1 [Irineochytrium annulatum]|nr:tRNA pseudouridine synthase 1 [Irineochytrium annulatum]
MEGGLPSKVEVEPSAEVEGDRKRGVADEDNDASNKRRRATANVPPASADAAPSALPAVQTALPVPAVKAPKRKIAILLGYCGTGYSGMIIYTRLYSPAGRNPNAKSIELELHKAFAAAGVVSADNAMEPAKVGFARCARTDKGVHAAGQVVSLNMMVIPNALEKINEHLPPQIRAYTLLRVTNSFNPKNLCDARLYEYMLPSYALGFFAPTDVYANSAVREEDESRKKTVDREAYRISQDDLERVRACLKAYEGTINFHNFTVGCEYKANSAKRFIKSFTCSDPLMRGLVILMVRTRTPPVLIPKCFESNKINIPKAPALGLFLRNPTFAAYNKKFGKKDGRPDIDFDSCKEAMDAFIEEWIYSKLVEEEVRDMV